MNLIAARGVLPLRRRLDRSPTLAYLPNSLKARWWRPRVTLRGLFRARRKARGEI